ncbi:MAG: 5-bromo-4-chloroindolyl phosphate hydrolysis family protein [Lachnospiraceae bacterium]|nr:5-bromo-4-chloroindolyl phosphate hydrolysis family protein [Lachnospiraceae bacterium]
MGNGKNNNHLGDEIRDSLCKGLKSGDYSDLNDAIIHSANAVFKDMTDSAGKAVGSKTREYQERIKREHEARAEKEASEKNNIRRQREELYRQQQEGKGELYKVPNSLPVNFNPIGNVSSKVCMVGGAVGMGVTGVSLLGNLAQAAFGVFSLTGFSLTLAVFGISALVFFKGVSDNNFLKKAKRYAEICGEKMYSKISDIAAKTGTKQSRVVKNINKMLRLGYFTQGYIDEKKTTLMLSDSLYDQYRQSEKNYLENKEGENNLSDGAKAGEAASLLSPAEQAELNSMIAEGMDSIEKLHTLNDRIPGEVISKKLDILERLLKEIFNRVKEHPEQMDRIHKLMDYYLPTMLKLVEAYAEYDSISSPGKEIVEAKVEIEKTLDTINKAFVRLLNNLYKDSVWDVTTDAKVLKTMLAQEGLADDMELMNF